MTLHQLKLTRRKLQGVEASAATAVKQAQKTVTDEQCKVRECERHVEAARDRAIYDAALLALESARKDHALAVKRLTDRQGEHAHAETQAHAACASAERRGQGPAR